MLKKLFILLKIGRKLALSDALKIVSKFHQPPFLIRILLGLFSISFSNKNYQLKKISDEEKLCNSIQDMGKSFQINLKNFKIVYLHFQRMRQKKLLRKIWVQKYLKQ